MSTKNGEVIQVTRKKIDEDEDEDEEEDDDLLYSAFSTAGRSSVIYLFETRYQKSRY